jgi:hypothetical protein
MLIFNILGVYFLVKNQFLGTFFGVYVGFTMFCVLGALKSFCVANRGIVVSIVKVQIHQNSPF